MTTKLLPQDIYLLITKWADPDHVPIDEGIGPLAWRTQYQKRLEQTIAEWLSKGLIAYQYPNRRVDAFIPISHLIGTSRDAISYLDSLADIAEQLKEVPDPNFRSHPRTPFLSDSVVLLGHCFSRAIAKAAEILACRFTQDESQQEQCFFALRDVLILMQAVKPDNAGSTLYATWSELFGKERSIFEVVTEKHPWVLEHAFALACYPACTLAAGTEVQSLLNDLEAITGCPEAPTILINDIKACREMITIKKSVRKAVVVPFSRPESVPSPNFGSMSTWYPDIASRHQYPSLGGAYAR